MKFVGWLWRVRAPLEYKVNRIYWSHWEFISTLSLATSQDAEGGELKFCFLANACFDRREVGTKIGDSSQEIAPFPPDCEQWVEGYPAKVWLSALFLYIPHSFVALMSFWQAHFPTHWMEQHMGCGSTNKIKTGTFYDFGRTFKYSAKKVHPFQHQKCSNEICHFL